MADAVRTTDAGIIAGRYTALEVFRAGPLLRARDCAALTIPSLLPPAGATQATTLDTPWQSLGARGTNNLASKLLLALFPPNSPFFRQKIDDKTIMELSQDEEAKAAVENALSQREIAIVEELEAHGIRVPAFEMLKLLVVTGNALLFSEDDGTIRIFRLDNYVVKRDPKGNVLEIVVHEKVSPLCLPEDIQVAIERVDKKPEEVVDLYTRILRTKTNYVVTQEAAGVPIPDSFGTYPLDKSPWRPLRWAAVGGEDYGRGLAEEYMGDLQSLETLTQAIVEGAAAAARLLFLVSSGTTRIKDLQNAPNCGFVAGNKDDVHALQVEKYADFRVALEESDRLEKRLSAAFMLNESATRPAERVTAEEIRYMAREIEDSFGGVYSVLSQDLQMFLVQRAQDRMESKQMLPKLPKDSVKITIITGLDALGRSHDLTKLNMFMGEMEPVADELKARLNFLNYANRVASGTGVDIKGLFMSDKDYAAQQAEQQNQAVMSAAMTSGAGTQVAKGIMDRMPAGAVPGTGGVAAPAGTVPGAPPAAQATPVQQ